MTETPMKRCSKCGREFPATLEFFPEERRNKSGLHARCRVCHRAYMKRYNHERLQDPIRRERERTRIREANRKRSQKPEVKLYNRESARRYANDPKNRERVLKQKREYAKQYYEKHREERLIYRTGYYASPRGKTAKRVNEHRREARKRGLPDNFTASDWERALVYFGGCCAVCGRPPGLWHTIAADHWIPLSSPDCPGTVPTNMIPLCHGVDGCNNSKHNREAAEWLIERFGKRRAAEILRRIDEYFDWVKAQG